eukprot:g1401.t1
MHFISLTSLIFTSAFTVNAMDTQSPFQGHKNVLIDPQTGKQIFKKSSSSPHASYHGDKRGLVREPIHENGAAAPHFTHRHALATAGKFKRKREVISSAEEAGDSGDFSTASDKEQTFKTDEACNKSEEDLLKMLKATKTNDETVAINQQSRNVPDIRTLVATNDEQCSKGELRPLAKLANYQSKFKYLHNDATLVQDYVPPTFSKEDRFVHLKGFTKGYTDPDFDDIISELGRIEERLILRWDGDDINSIAYTQIIPAILRERASKERPTVLIGSRDTKEVYKPEKFQRKLLESALLYPDMFTADSLESVYLHPVEKSNFKGVPFLEATKYDAENAALGTGALKDTFNRAPLGSKIDVIVLGGGSTIIEEIHNFVASEVFTDSDKQRGVKFRLLPFDRTGADWKKSASTVIQMALTDQFFKDQKINIAEKIQQERKGSGFNPMVCLGTRLESACSSINQEDGHKTEDQKVVLGSPCTMRKGKQAGQQGMCLETTSGFLAHGLSSRSSIPAQTHSCKCKLQANQAAITNFQQFYAVPIVQMWNAMQNVCQL